MSFILSGTAVRNFLHLTRISVIFYKVNDFFSSRNNKKFNFTAFEPLLLFSVFFLPGYLSQGMQEFQPDIFENTWFNLFYIITTLPQVVLTLYIIMLKPGRKLSDFDIYGFKLSDLPKSLLALAGIFVCIIPVGLISILIVPEIDNPVVYGAGWQFSRPSLIPLVLISCIATGYSEEIFFRAYLVKILEKSGVRLIPAAAVSAVLFGSGHIYEGFYAFAATATIGIFLSFVFNKTKSIHTISIAHGLYNFSVLMISMMGAQ